MSIIANKYRIDSILSKGSFGIICKGTNLRLKDEIVAIKIETRSKSLKHEVKILNYLYTNKIRTIPAIYWYGIYNENPCLVMTYYECSLSQYIEKKSLDKEKIHGIMYKMLEIISQIHDQWVVHRDLKPANFMIKNGEIYLIDFGLATFFITDGGHHIPNDESNTLIGSPKYISIYIFLGNRYSRRDDLISLVYIYCMMVLKDTPWDSGSDINTDIDFGITEVDEININHPKNKLRYKNRNLAIFLERYCLGMDEKFIEYLKYVYGLEYDEKPKYNYLLELFRLK